MNARPEQQRQVADTLSRILARKHPGTSWTVADGSSDTAPGTVVLQLARPDQLDAIRERRVSTARAA